jgi:hypothetical protein
MANCQAMGTSNNRLGRLLSAGGLLFFSLTACSGDESGPSADASGSDRDAGDDSPGGKPGNPDSGQPQVDPAELDRFSFFVTSLEGLQRLSRSQNGFGGDLRYGESHGLLGADEICEALAESSMPGARAKGWRAFLSAVEGPDGGQVDAIDRVGDGPWYDRLGRVVARNPDALINERPLGAHEAIVNDLPNEFGVPNHTPDPGEGPVDNHHMLTGTDENGRLHDETATCEDWSSTSVNAGKPRVGFSWPSDTRRSWMSQQDEAGCGAGVNIDQETAPDPDNPFVGSGGGYGGFYCFALRE